MFFYKGLSNEDEAEDKIIGEVAKKQKPRFEGSSIWML